MALNPFTQFVFDLFIISAIIITAYTCNFYYLTYLSVKRKAILSTNEIGTPTITIQLPIYNEKYVAKRLVDAVCAMDYPKEKMMIMVLDDSDDDTVELLFDVVAKYKKEGFQIEHIRRGTRKGYKAGALKYAMTITDTEFVAIFDADFIPPNWFLKKAMSHFVKPDIGLVQCRWGHVNENYSAITQAQALSLDFHFLIEQKAKSNSNLFMNFNGTAGIWRSDCIADAGGWHTATLVEDLDLSYRAQMKGWKCLFLPDIVVDAELPVQMNAAKRQQFRWAKGSIQCAIKLLADIALKRKISVEAKIQAFVQLTRHIVYPLMLIQFLTLPVLLAADMNLYLVSFVPALTIATYLAMGPGAYIMIIQSMYQKSWKSKVKILPALLVYNAGMSVNNSVAVFDAIFGKKNEFLRTPKYGIINKKDDWRDKSYNLPFTKTTLLEIFFGVYGLMGILISIFSNNPIFAPIIGLQTVGFFYISYMSLSHTRFKRIKSDIIPVLTKSEKMAKRTYQLSMIGVLAIIIFGGFMAINGYHSDIYPLDRMRGNLDGIIGSSDPVEIKNHLNAIKQDLAIVMEKLPESKNPVWIFPTESTNFLRIERDVNQLQVNAETISSVPKDSAAFQTGISNIGERSLSLRQNIMDATPYMFVSVSNIIFSTMWIAAILGIFTALKRRRDQLTKFDETAGV
ncbi:cellulose synthase family protein [Candidatus Nitrosarchaeum limnium]|jgi:cellulose synthase/poly-beta-1,6-N-acetylglucosamine synthase-like glycosyltransferase|uniref:Glycosyltransferase, group 2 family protein n=1 Tax=Candidatus Nitrosarchaeum limnium BG20 TaxID=859192 RepID=S2ELF2_9ARCH|nr:cellulose synthase family protein [Candidatus Nitrosarchaeum limnium]EPA05417.1 glycosyltransferase, group 2 family protein [Candidatus Nitrosarchaeum limnium BG20]